MDYEKVKQEREWYFGLVEMGLSTTQAIRCITVMEDTSNGVAQSMLNLLDSCKTPYFYNIYSNRGSLNTVNELDNFFKSFTNVDIIYKNWRKTINTILKALCNSTDRDQTYQNLILYVFRPHFLNQVPQKGIELEEAVDNHYDEQQLGIVNPPLNNFGEEDAGICDVSLRELEEDLKR